MRVFSYSGQIGSGKSLALDVAQIKLNNEINLVKEYISKFQDNQVCHEDILEFINTNDNIMYLKHDIKNMVNENKLKPDNEQNVLVNDILSFMNKIQLIIMKEDIEYVKPYFDKFHKDRTLDNLLEIEYHMAIQCKDKYDTINNLKKMQQSNDDCVKYIIVERLCVEHIDIFMKSSLDSYGLLTDDQINKVYEILSIYKNNLYDGFVDEVFLIKTPVNNILLKRICNRNQINDNNLSPEYINILSLMYDNFYDLLTKNKSLDNYVLSKTLEQHKNENTKFLDIDVTEFFETVRNKKITILDFKNTKIIAYMGNIGAGKTTAVLNNKLLRDETDDILVIPEPIEKWKDAFATYANDPTEKNIELVHNVISKSFQDIDNIILTEIGRVHTIYIERIPLESIMIFIKYYINKNSISDKHIFDLPIMQYISCSYMNRVDEIYILKTHSNVKELYDRVLKRGQINDENITYDYLASLEHLYDGLIELLTIPRNIVESDIDLSNDFQNKIVSDVINKIKKRSDILVKINSRNKE
jgi:dephospho-CoA kinase